MTATVRFTEEMLGHVTFGEADFDRGAEPTRDGAGALMFHLTIEVEEVLAQIDFLRGEVDRIRQVLRSRKPVRRIVR